MVVTVLTEVAGNVWVGIVDGNARVRVGVGVGGSAVWVGNGVWVADGVFCEEVGEEVCEAITGVEMRLEPDWVRIGVGVGRNIPGTTSSRSPP
jgi:hypothetical protein